ncbi:hypothetical protein SAY87_015471 [Trapa incisa]|uniref:Response regulatory domain-containing protein n=1 Tax=Trapa incisa TaxID=236973 RepID=A0AAN7JLZ8_9MYRT|nr:hypothetical protein SAY87_015471 [Trapa incisa]
MEVVESQFHVLAVDDSLIDRKLIERLLKTSSYQVTTVDSGSKALEFLGFREEDEQSSSDSPSGSPISHQVVEVNLVITDYCMPGMTGYDLLKKIKESSSLRNIPVVIMSSENVPSRINRCLEEGAEEFFLKPVKLSDLSRLRPHMMRTKLVHPKPGKDEEQEEEVESENKHEEVQPEGNCNDQAQQHSNKRKAAMEEGLSPGRTTKRPRYSGGEVQIYLDICSSSSSDHPGASFFYSEDPANPPPPRIHARVGRSAAKIEPGFTEVVRQHSACYFLDPLGVMVRPENIQHPAGPSIADAFMNGRIPLLPSMHSSMVISAHANRVAAPPNMIASQGSSIDLMHRVNGGIIKTETNYCGASPYMFAAESHVLESLSTIADASGASFSSVESTSQPLDEPLLDADTSSLGFLGPISVFRILLLISLKVLVCDPFLVLGYFLL